MCTRDRQAYSQNRDGYEVEVWLGGRWERSVVGCKSVVWVGCKARPEVLLDRGAGSGEQEEKKRLRCRVPPTLLEEEDKQSQRCRMSTIRAQHVQRHVVQLLGNGISVSPR